MGLKFILIGLAAIAKLSSGSPAVADISDYDRDASVKLPGDLYSQVSLSSVPNLNQDNQFDNHWNVPGFDLDLDALRLVRFSLDKDEEAVWMTEREKLRAKKAGINFVDVTEHPTFGRRFSLSPSPGYQSQNTYPKPGNSTSVPKIFPLLSSEEQKANLEFFTSFHTRYYNSETGRASSRWLFSKALNYTNTFATPALRSAVSIEVALVEHKFKQESIVIRLTPRSSNSSTPGTQEITVIGAHCDSLNYENPHLRSPGADDDGSGTVTVLEAYRGILKSGYIPSSPLEFHFYAGEEGGLLGSLDIVDSYVQANKTIRGMLQLDMTAWHKANTSEEIGVATNIVDPGLTDYLKLLIDTYLDIPWKETNYPGRAGSDHMSWTGEGYKSCHVIEGTWENMNREHVHGANDAIDVSDEFSFEHILKFTKLAVAFAVELSSY